MMYCVEAFLSREIWVIYNLVLEECQGFNAVLYLKGGNCELFSLNKTQKLRERKDTSGACVCFCIYPT